MTTTSCTSPLTYFGCYQRLEDDSPMVSMQLDSFKKLCVAAGTPEEEVNEKDSKLFYLNIGERLFCFDTKQLPGGANDLPLVEMSHSQLADLTRGRLCQTKGSPIILPQALQGRLVIPPLDDSAAQRLILTVRKVTPTKQSGVGRFKPADLSKALLEKYSGFPLTKGQKITLQFQHTHFKLQVSQLTALHPIQIDGSPRCYAVPQEKTEVVLDAHPNLEEEHEYGAGSDLALGIEVSLPRADNERKELVGITALDKAIQELLAQDSFILGQTFAIEINDESGKKISLKAKIDSLTDNHKLETFTSGNDITTKRVVHPAAQKTVRYHAADKGLMLLTQAPQQASGLTYEIESVTHKFPNAHSATTEVVLYEDELRQALTDKLTGVHYSGEKVRVSARNMLGEEVIAIGRLVSIREAERSVSYGKELAGRGWRVGSQSAIAVSTKANDILLACDRRPRAARSVTFTVCNPHGNLEKCNVLRSQLKELIRQSTPTVVNGMALDLELPLGLFRLRVDETLLCDPKEATGRDWLSHTIAVAAATKIKFVNKTEGVVVLKRKDSDMDIEERLRNQGIGGLSEESKQQLRLLVRRLNNPLDPEYRLKARQHILFHGDPGLGKSAMAQAILESLGIDNITIKPMAEFNNKWVGGTEKNIREPFDRSRQAPDELFGLIIEEVDGMGSRGDNAHVNSAVTQLLFCLENAPSNMVIIAITNRKDALDKALIRDGRFGIHLGFSKPKKEEIADIYRSRIAYHCRGCQVDVDYEALAEASHGFAGSAIFNVLHLTILAKSDSNPGVERSRLSYTTDDFLKVIATLPRQEEESWRNNYL